MYAFVNQFSSMTQNDLYQCQCIVYAIPTQIRQSIVTITYNIVICNISYVANITKLISIKLMNKNMPRNSAGHFPT